MKQKRLIRVAALFVGFAIIGTPLEKVCSCVSEDPDPLVFVQIEEMNLMGLDHWNLRGTITSQSNHKDDNLREWAEYFYGKEGDYIFDDIQALIFDSHILQLEEIRDCVRKNKPLPSYLEGNSVARFWKKNPQDESLDYAVFAKRCEHHAILGNPWMEGEDHEVRQPPEMSHLIEEGLQLRAACHSQLIQLRYAYQIVRLAHYAGMFKESVDYYNELVLNNPQPSVIRYMAMSQKCGAAIGLLKKPGADERQRIETLRDIGKAYRNCPSCRLLSYYDLDLFKAEDYFKAAATAEHPDDQIGIWLVAGKRTIPVHIAIEKMYKVAPAAPELEVLLSRQLYNKQQQYAANIVFCSGLSPKIAAAVAKDAELQQSITLIEKIAANKNTARPGLWSLAAGYLNFVRGACDKAEAYYTQCNSQLLQGTDGPIAQALDYLTLVLDISKVKQYDKSSDAFVAELLSRILSTGNGNLKEYGLMRLRNFFKINGMEKEGWLVVNILNRQEYYPFYYRWDETFENFLTLQNIDAMIAECKRAPKTLLEQKLWGHSLINENVLLDHKATLLFHAHQFKEAIALIHKNKAAFTEKFLNGDPFKARVHDCYSCEDERQGAIIRRNEFIAKMAELEDSMRTPGALQAYYHFKYATGLYNMTFYGHERDVISWNLSPEGGAPTAHCELHWIDAKNTLSAAGALSDAPYANASPRFYYDNREAMRYYIKAADLSHDREFKAKCIFMAAKCEQNEFYNRGGNPEYDWEDKHWEEKEAKLGQIKNNWYRTQFKKLKSEYGDTEYAKDMIYECSYFGYYASTH